MGVEGYVGVGCGGKAARRGSGGLRTCVCASGGRMVVVKWTGGGPKVEGVDDEGEERGRGNRRKRAAAAGGGRQGGGALSRGGGSGCCGRLGSPAECRLGLRGVRRDGEIGRARAAGPSSG